MEVIQHGHHGVHVLVHVERVYKYKQGLLLYFVMFVLISFFYSLDLVRSRYLNMVVVIVLDLLLI